VQWWVYSGNILPWSLLQGGGMLLVLWFASLHSSSQAPALQIQWTYVIALYTLAKVFELADHAVFELSGNLVSGHSLKHIVAACAAWPVITALMNAQKMRAESETA
jgi:hypothetical protein